MANPVDVALNGAGNHEHSYERTGIHAIQKPGEDLCQPRSLYSVGSGLGRQASGPRFIGNTDKRFDHPRSRDERELASEHGHYAAQHGTLAAR